MINDGQPATPAELLRTDQILSQMTKDLEIEYTVNCGSMTHKEAHKHFRIREALMIVRGAVVDKGENLCK